jgi:malate synthase
MDDGRPLTPELYRGFAQEELEKHRKRLGAAAFDSMRYPQAAALLDDLVLHDEFTEFLTLPAYEML